MAIKPRLVMITDTQQRARPFIIFDGSPYLVESANLRIELCEFD
jgi:hypothetical protein